jgi:hypothetical protein
MLHKKEESREIEAREEPGIQTGEQIQAKHHVYVVVVAQDVLEHELVASRKLQVVGLKKIALP